MRELKLNCPNCGQIIDIIINDAGEITLRHFDVYSNSSMIEKLQYEFGSNNMKGGVMGDEQIKLSF